MPSPPPRAHKPLFVTLSQPAKPRHHAQRPISTPSPPGPSQAIIWPETLRTGYLTYPPNRRIMVVSSRRNDLLGPYRRTGRCCRPTGIVVCDTVTSVRRSPTGRALARVPSKPLRVPRFIRRPLLSQHHARPALKWIVPRRYGAWGPHPRHTKARCHGETVDLFRTRGCGLSNPQVVGGHWRTYKPSRKACGIGAMLRCVRSFSRVHLVRGTYRAAQECRSASHEVAGQGDCAPGQSQYSFIQTAQTTVRHRRAGGGNIVPMRLSPVH